MSTLAADNGPFDPTAGQVPSPAAAVVRVPRGLYVKAAERLVSQEAGPRQAAARRFVSAAPSYGIDLSLMWGVLSGSGRSVRQVCLAVHGAGRTAMLFVSGARPEGEEPADVGYRAACIDAACRHVAVHGAEGGKGVRRPAVLAQALLEPDEAAQAAGLTAAGFSRLGGLAYLALRRGQGGFVAGGSAPAMPEGVTVRTAASIARDRRDGLLTGLLDQTYVETLDCPELCGLREARDVLESHRAVGVHDPNLWWVAFGPDAADGGSGAESRQPIGCMLLNPCPEQDAIELVYLGLAPGARGRGVARWLLDHGLRSVSMRPESRITCAVDLRNGPAMRLYQRAGFARLGERTPFVRGIRSC